MLLYMHSSHWNFFSVYRHLIEKKLKNKKKRKTIKENLTSVRKPKQRLLIRYESLSE